MGTPAEPTGLFRESFESQPEDLGSSGSTFKAKLAYRGNDIGYLGQDNSGWAMIVKAESDAVDLEQYLWPHDSQDYYKDQRANWLSVKAGNDEAGFYPKWNSASSWTIAGSAFINGYSGGKLSMYSESYAYLYARNDYEILDVQLILQ